MRAGTLRHRIQIQQKTVTQNTYGEEIVAWAELTTVWGSVEDLSGREFYEARQVPAAEVTTRVCIRYRSDVEPTMRVIHGGRTLEIVSVLDPEGRKRETILMCRELVG